MHANSLPDCGQVSTLINVIYNYGAFLSFSSLKSLPPADVSVFTGVGPRGGQPVSQGERGNGKAQHLRVAFMLFKAFSICCSGF